ncbi:hypothetical protein CJO66_26935 [Burkholderia ubonensis]|uniref:hypothetical protein n=1 Tax=Burkholderia ubonensis TaxID=101571 RepID=UPI000BA5142D|nr:hypothetical protein [Burkholderia ubonensis]PAK11660.1 hypothetical protein CJO66_26935 [Burkholderia ubonensis]RQP86065.1 hypothetical protein DF009_34235 [Burkholderia ubonensis]
MSARIFQLIRPYEGMFRVLVVIRSEAWRITTRTAPGGLLSEHIAFVDAANDVAMIRQFSENHAIDFAIFDIDAVSASCFEELVRPLGLPDVGGSGFYAADVCSSLEKRESADRSSTLQSRLPALGSK